MNLSPKYIKNIITQNKFNIKKNLGQNFLLDEDVLNKIIDISCIDENSTVLEIGPGFGFLTDYLLNKAKKVIAVEIDKSLCNILENKYKNNNKFTLINGDFIKLTKDNAKANLQIDNDTKITCVANLPYYITSPILMRLLELDFVNDINIMVQKEVGDRIYAKPSTKDYGILTLMVLYYSTPIDRFNVSRNCFYPSPSVDSTVLRLVKNNNNYNSKLKSFTNQDFLFFVIRESFSLRRKKLTNSLSSSSGISKEKIKFAIEKMGFDENVRAENLSLEDYITLSGLIEQN